MDGMTNVRAKKFIRYNRGKHASLGTFETINCIENAMMGRATATAATKKCSYGCCARPGDCVDRGEKSEA